jgi:hypothetical protein
MALPLDVYDVPVRVEWKLMASIRTDAPTTTNVELAKSIGVNVNTIGRWLKEPQYQRYENWMLTKNFETRPLSDREAILDVSDEFTEGSLEMQDRLRNIISMTNDPKLEASLCQDWLDRAGYAPQRKIAQSGGKTLVLTAEAMEVIFRRGHEAGLHSTSETLPPAIEVSVERAAGS